ncbi:pseudaminic acid biosynthesis-associated methylase [Altererythrobacter litoralis]|uniref:Pseudaminic acid biosynthesis-associated methylase n=1 Tax=Altererythrobacter litoralis TaxID=3113904 RepID=A0ABU7GF06_9SPHN|nr:pseudaminic acid biosynthesis-associated methylase [Erythrobacteraceae bacterium 1XM1-14]
MAPFKTDQEKFWAGKFGTEYIQRNQGDRLLASNLAFFSKALGAAHEVSSCVEFGANIGMNLKALRLLHPDMHLYGIEINTAAATQLAQAIGSENCIQGSILEITPPECDLALIKGVLIHINPDALPDVYDKLAAATRRWLLVAEYYNPSPVSIPYRDHDDRLFKRDFAGEIMERHPSFRLVDYGFAYRRDPQFPQDDITWFLMEKKG